MRITREQAKARGCTIDDDCNPPVAEHPDRHGSHRKATFTFLETHLMTQLEIAARAVQPTIPLLAEQFNKALDLAFSV